MADKNKLYIGAAYYPEVWPQSCVDEDIDRMKEVGCNCMRLGEFAWGDMEPEEGRFDFSWLISVMDKLYAAGISVVLCTPTATPPKWLTDKYPETLMLRGNGVRKTFGGRAHVCKTSPVMREKNRIIVTELCKAAASHPSVIGWQIDNEIYPNDEGCFCPLCINKFRRYLKEKYQTVDALNEAWGSARWSLQYRSFDDVDAPVSGTWNHPSLCVEWLRFQSENIADYVDEQAAVIKKYSSAPVGTDMMPILGQDYYRTTKNLDVIQFNHYDEQHNLFRPSFWFDFLRPIKDIPFWNTETQTCWNGSLYASSGYRSAGNCYVNTWLPIAKGGAMNLYWLWRAHYTGHEMAHGAVCRTSGGFYHMAKEIRKASDEFAACEQLLSENKVISDIAVHMSATAWRIFNYVPMSYGMNYIEFIRDNFHKPLRHYNVDVIDTAHDIENYKIIFSPFLAYTAENGFRERIKKWVNAGGTWIVGPMSDIMTDYAAKYRNATHGFLEEFAGVKTVFEMPIPNDVFRAQWKDGSPLGISHVFYGYEPDGAESLADYINDWPQGSAVVTVRRVGNGRVILLGSMPDGEGLKKLISLQPIAEASDNVELVARGSDIIIAVELDNTLGYVRLDGEYVDKLSGRKASGHTDLAPYSVSVFVKVRRT